MMKSSILFLGLLLSMSPLQADWVLDNAHSHLSFITIKNSHIAENNHFKQLSGSLDASGKATLNIDLNSVETRVDIRNQRLQDILFETVKYPQAVVSLQIDPSLMTQLAIGASITQPLEAVLDLHGASNPVQADVVITRSGEATWQVSSQAPILLQLEPYTLLPGVEKLREIAGLKVITQTVPVSFILSFNQTGKE